jgi:putative oxidoreductase
MELQAFLVIVARVLLGGGFLFIGLRNIKAIDGISMPLQAHGIPYPKVATGIGIAAQIVFGAMVLVGLWVFWAALGLLVFVILATALYHNFLAAQGEERATHFNAALGNVLLAGGLFALAATGL